MPPVLLVSIVLAALSPAVAMVLLIRRRRRRINERLRAELEGEEVLAAAGSANLIGVESKGLGQLRGNGVLVLTRRRLVFRMWVGGVNLDLPLSSIQGADTTRSVAGKSVGRRLVRVRFTDPQGRPDAAGFALGEPDAWVERIERVREQALPPEGADAPNADAPNANAPGASGAASARRP